MKKVCGKCIYCEMDSWNTPNGLFCEIKNEKLDESDFLYSRVDRDKECDELNIDNEFWFEERKQK